MRALQIVLLVVVISAVVFGVTLLRQFTDPKDQGPGLGTTVTASEAQVRFPQKVAYYGGGLEEVGGGEAETKAPGSYAFWFENLQEADVPLALRGKSCTCAKVEVCLVSPAGKAKLAPVAATQVLAAGQGWGVFGPWGAAQEVLGKPPADPTADWFELQDESRATARGEALPKPFTVPKQALGWVRLAWNTDKVGPQRFWAELRTETGSPIRLEVPVIFVDPISVEQAAVMVGELRPEGQKETELLVWSHTRYHFDLSPEVLPADPCVTCGTPVPLTYEERMDLSRKRHFRVRSGYRLTVRAQERTPDGHHLEMGPFRRQLVLKNDIRSEPENVTVVGLVRGDIQVGVGAARDVIAFGAFPADAGPKTEITLATDRTDLELALGEHPDFLSVELDKGKQDANGRTWVLKVAVQKNRVSGEFPTGSAIYLNTLTQPPRRLRIPVTGTAFR
jgi:hypothetical protein